MTPLLAAIQFLTRIPTPQLPFTGRTLPNATAWFPLVGTLLGALAALLHHLLTPHLSPVLAALATVTFLVLLTGALHEDALADCADAFGLSRPKTRTIEIMRDSAIGSFGASALILAFAARILLLAALPATRTTPILIAALTFSRWSTLPLTLLPPATPERGQGMTIARRTPPLALIFGTITTLAVAFLTHTLIPLAISAILTALAALYFHRRLQGTTGDCFGATNQLVEIAVLTCGAWHP